MNFKNDDFMNLINNINENKKGKNMKETQKNMIKMKNAKDNQRKIGRAQKQFTENRWTCTTVSTWARPITIYCAI